MIFTSCYFTKLSILLAIFKHLVLLQVLSIDYGSSFYKVGLVQIGNPMEIVLNRESKRITPPCVGFKDNVRLIGNSAAQIMKKMPSSVFCDFHLLLGRKFDDPVTQKFIQQHPYIDLRPGIGHDLPVFHPKGFDITFTPEELLAQIINESSTNAGGVRTFVFTMPPLIDHSMRNSIKTASNIVKASLIGIVDTATAVAYQFVINKKSEILSGTSSVSMIFDVGAVYTTTTILKIYSENVTGGKQARADIIGLGFVPYGGDHITECVYDIMLNKLKNEFSEYSEMLKNHRKKSTLKAEAEKVKIALSTNPEASFYIEMFYDEKDFSGKISRELLEEKCKKTFENISKSIDHAFTSAKLSKSGVDSIVLMGKGSRTYSLHQHIREKSGKDKLSGVLNTEDSIALGASFKGADISKQFKVAKISVHPGVPIPIVVMYRKEEFNATTNSTENKTHSRVIFPHMSDLTQKRAINIFNVSTNITLTLKYGDIPDIYSESVGLIHDKNLMEILIYGIEDAVQANPLGVLKCIKITFAFDTFGMIQLSKAEAKFDKREEKSAFSKVLSSIGSVFGYGENENENSTSTAETTNESNGKNSTLEPEAINATAKNTTNSSVNATEVKPKGPKFLESYPLKHLSKELFLASTTELNVSQSFMKLKRILMKELKKEAEAKAKSDLEAFIYSTREQLSPGSDYHGVLNESEFKNLTDTLETVASWFDENGFTSDHGNVTERHKLLTNIVSVAEERIIESKALKVELESFFRIHNLSHAAIMDAIKIQLGSELLNQSYFDEISSFINELHKNVTTLQKKQSTLKPYEEPVLRSEYVKFMRSMIHYRVDQMVAEVRKMSYKKKTVNETKTSGQGNTTTTFNETVKNKSVTDSELKKNVTLNETTTTKTTEKFENITIPTSDKKSSESSENAAKETTTENSEDLPFIEKPVYENDTTETISENKITKDEL